MLTLWWTARCSLIKRRQHLLSESEALLRELPPEFVERLPSVKRVRPRLAALPRATARRGLTPPAAVRVRVRGGLSRADRQPRRAGQADHLSARRACLTERLHSRSAGRALDRVGLPSRWSRSATAALDDRWLRALQRHCAAGRLDAEGPGEPRRHRYNRAATPSQRGPAPHGDHLATLRAAREKETRVARQGQADRAAQRHPLTAIGRRAPRSPKEGP